MQKNNRYQCVLRYAARKLNRKKQMCCFAKPSATLAECSRNIELTPGMRVSKWWMWCCSMPRVNGTRNQGTGWFADPSTAARRRLYASPWTYGSIEICLLRARRVGGWGVRAHLEPRVG